MRPPRVHRPSTGQLLRAVQGTPRPVLDAAAALAGAHQAVRPGKGIRQWSANVETLTGRRPSAAERAAATRSWARTMVESAQLGSWTPTRIVDRVEIDPAAQQRLIETHRDTGAVLALPHLGSWDHAGAWACQVGLPVSSVAEQLADDEFEFFRRAREAIGFRVYSHSDPRALSHLLADQREGRMTCLLVDRQLGGGGVPVSWSTASGPVPTKVPGGAAHVALRTGSTLLAVTTYYTGARLHIDISEPITAPSGKDQLARMCQQLVDVFARETARHVVDWHMLQPFFPGVVAA